MLYNISDYDLKQSQIKLLKTYSFQKSSYLKTKDGLKLSMFDISYNANISKKYSSELLNLVNSQHIFNRHIVNYIPLFLTITLDGCYRRMLNGDYSEFNEIRVKNEFPKDLRYKAYLKIPLSIKDCYLILNYQFKKMRDRYLKKFNISYRDYIKVPEPHKNGVPHLHILFYVPDDKKIIDYLKKIFKECCPAPQNHSNKHLSSFQKKNKETQGFQMSITNSTSYILKYILKTFRNINQSDFKINKLNAWYIKYKIRRFTRSHLFTYNKYRFPMVVYRKIRSIIKSISPASYSSLSDVLYDFHIDEECSIAYNLDKKKGDIFIHLKLVYHEIFYTKEKTIISYFAERKWKNMYKQKIINNNLYQIDYDKNIVDFCYKLYYDDFVTA